jgi:CRISPR-associated endonuclease/helicase Cas3
MTSTYSVEEAYRWVGIDRPARHQRDVWNHLTGGLRVVLQAPTGSGKTEAVLLPYLVRRARELPARLVYTLPLRSVTEQVAARLTTYRNALLGEEALAVRVQHGERPESALLAADAVIATVDQVISSFACAPLSLPARHGNIPAGGILTSFVVFDEVHLLDPELALQAIRILCHRLRAHELPFVIMTATLPHRLIEAVAGELDAKVVSSWDEFVSRRIEVAFQPTELTVASISSLFQRSAERILVVCNTVDRAIGFYRAIEPVARAAGYDCELLHGRFLPEDRQRKEEWIRHWFGKNRNEGKAILVATQVVEVGLDLSADLLVTELAPIDALVQRIGRVARWGGQGCVEIVDVPDPAPYEKELVEKTRRILLERDRWLFSWSTVQSLIDDVLDERLWAAWSGSDHVGKIVQQLNKAAFEGSRALVAAAIRDQDSVRVSVIDREQVISCSDFLRLPWVNVPLGTARRWLRRSQELGCPAQLVTIDENRVEDTRPTVVCKKIDHRQVRLGAFVVFDAKVVSYHRELGLAEGVSGHGFETRQRIARERFAGAYQYQRETWYEHVRRVVEGTRELVAEERHGVEGLARRLRCSVNEVERAALLAAVLHDVGKLTREWQVAAGVGPDAAAADLLAHTGREGVALPPHATVSAYCCYDAVLGGNDLPETLRKAVMYAVAHHHSVRAREVPKYTLHRAWREAVATMLAETELCDVVSLDRVFCTQASTTQLRDRIPRFDWPVYDAYVLLARWLRLADWKATGGPDAVRDYEDWFGRL